MPESKIYGHPNVLKQRKIFGRTNVLYESKMYTVVLANVFKEKNEIYHPITY